MKMPGIELPTIDIPKLEMPRLGLAFFRRRLFFRAVFLALIVATLGLALSVLQDEKERSYQSYQASFKKTQSEILARLRHPAGQLALLNPQHGAAPDGAGLTPLLLPFGALDFDDPFKAQQAIDSAGCAVQLKGGASVCAAIGNNPYAGGFVYLAGSFNSSDLQGREKGQLSLLGIARAKVSLSLRGSTTTWIAPLELQDRESASAGNALVGRWAGFLEADTQAQGSELIRESRPVREFRGWVWQSSACAALLLPVTDDGTLDTPRALAHAQRMLEAGCDGVTLFGTTGEGPAFTMAERTGLLEAMVAHGIRPDQIIVTTTALALGDAIELGRHASGLGVHRQMLMPPFFFNQPKDAGIIEAVSQVVRGIGDDGLKLLLYHFPFMSTFGFSHAAIAELVRRHPGQVMGVKDSSGDLEHSLALSPCFPGFVHSGRGGAPCGTGHVPRWIGLHQWPVQHRAAPDEAGDERTRQGQSSG